jgi:hypothetical protein
MYEYILSIKILHLSLYSQTIEKKNNFFLFLLTYAIFFLLTYLWVRFTNIFTISSPLGYRIQPWISYLYCFSLYSSIFWSLRWFFLNDSDVAPLLSSFSYTCFIALNFLSLQELIILSDSYFYFLWVCMFYFSV